MPKTEVRDSKHSCARCGLTLREIWSMGRMEVWLEVWSGSE